MNLPDWVERGIKEAPQLQAGSIHIEFWDNGVTKFEILDRRLPPKKSPTGGAPGSGATGRERAQPR